MLALALLPGAPIVAAKAVLLLALAWAAGRLLKAAADALLGGTDDLPRPNPSEARTSPPRAGLTLPAGVALARPGASGSLAAARLAPLPLHLERDQARPSSQPVKRLFDA